MQNSKLKSKIEHKTLEVALKPGFSLTGAIENPPFEELLGASLKRATPLIKEHFGLPVGVYHYRGVMHRVWRREGLRGTIALPFLKLASQVDMLFGCTGEEIPFELINKVERTSDGRLSMTWERLFYFPKGCQRFFATMLYDPQRQLILDYLGNRGQLEVELQAQIRQGGMFITSGKQWWRVGHWRLPFPKLLAGQAKVCEWQEGEEFCINVTIQNPILGQFFGYTGRFQAVKSR